MNDKYYWYLEDDKYLEGNEAYEYVKKLNVSLTNLKSEIIRKLDDISRYITECEINNKNDYEAIFENVMNIGEVCSNTMIMLEMLIEDINREINKHE